ncbi:hypothetical protein [Microbulbifer elongatus]|uniref:hypothetical protein n=1 Tax=Microbulbifer elongatus TaxID=86173 RepID=UPI001CFEEB3C|nr:hypothetical protein [Microbulbifer elongatus]
MNIAQELKELNLRTSVILAALFCAFLGPGALLILYFDKELFLEIETTKLILLSFGIASPGVVIPVAIGVLLFPLFHKENVTTQELRVIATLGFFRHSFNNAVVLYGIVFLAYSLTLSIPYFLRLYGYCIGIGLIFEVWRVWQVSRTTVPGGAVTTG